MKPSSQIDDRPRIAVTMGDPAGIGPELCLRLLAEASLRERCVPIVFGNAVLLDRVACLTGLPRVPRVLSLREWKSDWASVCEPMALDLPEIDVRQVSPGCFNAATGKAGYSYIDRAIDAAMSKEVDAVTTGPLNKEALHAAGISFPGHTEIFAQRTNSKRWCMLQYSEAIVCSFVTVHVGYAEVPALLSVARILEVIELTHEALIRLRGHAPRMVVCGLNPHAGEHGLFGEREEELFIEPAVLLARGKGIQVEGPLPPDTAFVPEKRRATDAFVCMYHDQGHIPLKALAFDSAVNTTLGLPLVRTSVDHGTAGDIAWQGKANPGSMFAAVELAVRLASS